MHIDEYKRQVVELLKAGDQNILEEAAECILFCSEAGHPSTELIDRRLGIYEEPA